MVLGNLDSYTHKKKKLNHQLTPYTKINSRRVNDLNIHCDTITVLEENMGRKISDIPHRIFQKIFRIFSPLCPLEHGI